MARAWIEDLWFSRNGDGAKQPTQRHGRGLQWRVRWFDDRRHLKSKAFRTKREAEAWQATVEAELRGGTYRDRTLGEARLADVAAEWLATRSDITRSSRDVYQGELDRHVLPRWGAAPVARIRRGELAVWFAEMAGRLSPRSVIRVHRVLAMVLQWAVETDRIVSNPASRLPLPRPGHAEHVFLTHAEVDGLASAAGRSKALVLTLAYTGLRFGEVAALQVSDLDLARRRLGVNRAWAGLNTAEPYLSAPKTHERRKVGLPRFLIAEVAEHVVGREPDAWLFTSPQGCALNLPNWRRREFKSAVVAAGLQGRGLTPHSLRHTAASLAIAAGADVKVVQTMLGHKDAAMTLNVYAGLFPDRLDEVADALDEARELAVPRPSPTTAPTGETDSRPT